ncbi:MAG: serine hydrolase domain-containing protein [Nannocystales bacterium]
MTRVCLLLSALALTAGCKPARTTNAPGPSEPQGPSVVAADIDINIKERESEARTPENLDVLLDDVRAKTSVPGIAAAVIDRRGVLAIGASGTRRADEPAELTTDDLFHLGSDTKAMTALLVARLVESGVLRWDMTMAEAFGGNAMHEDFRDVTLTQLMRHRSGVSTAMTDLSPGIMQRLEPLTVVERRALVTSEALAMAPRSTPGSHFEYSNFGYVIVGAAVERAVGRSWEAELTAQVFEPLGMKSCGFGPTATGEDRDQPWAHADMKDKFVPVEIDNPPFLGPAGTVHCSLADWGRFAAVFFDDASFVSADSVDHLTSAVPKSDGQGGYALGWAVPELEAFGIPVLAHDGSNTVNYATIVVMPSLGAAVLVAVNAGGDRAQQAAVAAAFELAKQTRGPQPD